MVLANYKPQEVLKHFEAISQIPRGSGNEKAVSDYIAKFARDLGHETVQDNLYNLIIYKPGVGSGASSPPIILQAHLDIVCEKNADTEHNFLTDPLNLYVDGDFIKARGTTLGADNGLGVAMCMAMLEDKELPHPPLEIVLTVEEESGMAGASNLDTSLLKSKRMINLDNGDDTAFVMGSAAGTTAELVLPAKWEAVCAGTEVLTVTVKGLMGGHSGGDIEKERGNANRIIGAMLAALDNDVTVRVANISGGMKVNALPREGTVTIAIREADKDKVIAILEKCRKDFAVQYRASDSGIDISWTADKADKTLSAEITSNLIAALTLIPNGVQHLSMEIEGLTNASCNLGVVETLEDGIKLSLMPRGASRFYNERTESQIAYLAKLTGGVATFMQRSPAWPFNPDSELLKTAVECYKPVFGRDVVITATHGGLECGILAEKIEGLDIIAIGPTNIDLHTPDERLSISSTEKTWEFFKFYLAAL